MISQIIVFILGFLFGLFVSTGIYFIYLNKEKFMIFNRKNPHKNNMLNTDRTDEIGLIDVDSEIQDDNLPFINSGNSNNISLKYNQKRYDRNHHTRKSFNHNIHQTIY